MGGWGGGRPGLPTGCWCPEGGAADRLSASFPRDGPIGPGEEGKVRVDFVPRQAGLRKLVVDFESDRLKGVKGYRNVIIAPLPK